MLPFLHELSIRKSAEQNEIQRLEAAAKNDADASKINTLLKAYQSYQTTYPADKEKIVNYLNNAKSILDERLPMLRDQTFDEATGVVNQDVAAGFIRLVEQYAMLLPQEKDAPRWLFEAGEMAGALHQYDKTLSLYQKINDDFSNYEKSSQVLFMRAFTLDNELKQLEEAKTLYEQFLQKYPKDDFADDAQFLLNNLGKSEDEMLRSFQK